MKALLLQQPGRFERVELEEPGGPRPGEALLRVHRVGVCGTDVGGFLGKMPFFSYPRIPGHELGVEVVDVGANVTNVKAGDRCSVEPYMNCGECVACKKAAGNCCVNLKVLGVMTDGGLRDRFVLRADKLHPSAKLSFDQLALVETLAIGCHAVDRAGLAPGESCLVVGAGPIGLASIVFAKLAGARVTVLDVNAKRLQFCRDAMGVDETIEKPGDKTADVVIDATGNNAAMSSAFGYVAPTGRLVFVGITTKEVTFAHPPFHKLEGTLLCSRNALPRDFARIIKLIEDGRIDTRPWITHHLAFDAVPGQFESCTRPESGVIKAIIDVQ
jgi:2-desacetyl-2-hydroxyethyl bacteriochlorophyllide A dehydrogenase